MVVYAIVLLTFGALLAAVRVARVLGELRRHQQGIRRDEAAARRVDPAAGFENVAAAALAFDARPPLGSRCADEPGALDSVAKPGSPLHHDRRFGRVVRAPSGSEGLDRVRMRRPPSRDGAPTRSRDATRSTTLEAVNRWRIV